MIFGFRSVHCDDPACATILGWPDGDLCEDCQNALKQQGIATEDVQLSLDDEQAAA